MTDFKGQYKAPIYFKKSNRNDNLCLKLADLIVFVIVILIAETQPYYTSGRAKRHS